MQIWFLARAAKAVESRGNTPIFFLLLQRYPSKARKLNQENTRPRFLSFTATPRGGHSADAKSRMQGNMRRRRFFFCAATAAFTRHGVEGCRYLPELHGPAEPLEHGRVRGDHAPLTAHLHRPPAHLNVNNTNAIQIVRAICCGAPLFETPQHEHHTRHLFWRTPFYMGTREDGVGRHDGVRNDPRKVRPGTGESVQWHGGRSANWHVTQASAHLRGGPDLALAAEREEDLEEDSSKRVRHQDNVCATFGRVHPFHMVV